MKSLKKRSLASLRERYTVFMHQPYCSSQGKAGAPPYPGNHLVLDQACLLNEANSLQCRAVSYIKLSLLKSTMLSISHTAKILKQITLSDRFVTPNFSNWLCLHEPSSLYAHGEQCPSYFLAEIRLCASDPVQDCIKGEPLCKPC